MIFGATGVATCRCNDTVDGRNPAPVCRWCIPLFTGFYIYEVVKDFFHQQYHKSCSISFPRIEVNVNITR